MPKGKKVTAEEMREKLAKYNDMGPAFQTLAKEVSEDIEACEAITSQSKELKKKVKGGFKRLQKAEDAFGPPKPRKPRQKKNKDGEVIASNPKVKKDKK